MRKHQAQTERFKHIFQKPFSLVPFLQMEASLAPFQQRRFSESSGRWAGVDTKKATAEPTHTFQEQSHGFKKPNRNLELDPWSHLFVAVSAHFSCLRSLSGTIEVTVISVVGGAPGPEAWSPLGALVFRDYAFSPWLCYWLTDAGWRLPAWVNRVCEGDCPRKTEGGWQSDLASVVSNPLLNN